MMAQAWKTVRIFISSTFRDMHAERDHLVRFVFPELRERCAKRQLHLVDVDLRWGVTEEEAERKVLEICLDEIERCRPFFIGLLGERYGWVPPKYEVPDERYYDWVREFEPGHSITAMEIYHGVLRNPAMKMRAFFYFRDPTFLLNVPDSHWEVFQPESKESAEKLKRLKDDIRKNCPVFDYSCAFGGISEDGKIKLTGLEAFGQRVLEDFWSAISQEYPVVETPPDELAIERIYHEAFIEGRCQRFIGRRDLLEQMTAYADSENNVPLVITGAAGCGKSALLANFARAYSKAHSDVFVLPHFIGLSPGSTDIRRTLLRLCRELAKRFGITDEIPEDYEELRKVFPKFLMQAASRVKVLLLIDAPNQLDESYHAHTLNWLPLTLPKNLRLIVSTLEGDCLDALHRRRLALSEITVVPLTPEERKQIIRQMLWDYRKRLDERPKNDQIGMLLSKGESDNPLYLIVACEELRVFGEFEKVTERITSLPDDVPALFEQVLERLEHDHGKELVKSALSLLECSRYGLLETEMLELLRRDGEEQLPRAIWAQLYRSLQFYLRPPGERGEGMLDFFHRQLAKAVQQRYLEHDEEKRSGHQRLAEYFKRKADPTGDAMWKGNYPRGLSELPYHQTRGKMWQELEQTLCDLCFIEAKCLAISVFDALYDFLDALAKMPSDHSALASISALHRAVDRYSYTLKDDPLLVVPQVFNSLYWNWDETTILGRRLHNTMERYQRTWLRRVNRPTSTLESEPLRVIPVHVEGDWIKHIGFLPDGHTIASVSLGEEVTLWDVQTGQEKYRLVAPRHSAYSVVLSPDRRKVGTVTHDKTVILWDTETGKVDHVLHGHGALVYTLAFTPDGQTVASGGLDWQVILWDTKSGCERRRFKYRGGSIRSLAFSPDGQTLAGGDEVGPVILWDVETGQERSKLVNHDNQVISLAFSPDCRLLASGSIDRSVILWDLETGTLKWRFVGHDGWVCSVAFSPDGMIVASGSTDKSVILWDTATGQQKQRLVGHGGLVSTVAFSPDGQIVASGSRDGKIQLCRTTSNRKTGHEVEDKDSVIGIAFSSDGRYVVTGYSGGTAILWDAHSGELKQRYQGYTEGRLDVVFSPDDRIVATLDSFNEVTLWDTETGRKKRSFWLSGNNPLVGALAVSPDSRTVASGRAEGSVILWDVKTQQDPDRQKVDRHNTYYTNEELTGILWEKEIGIEKRRLCGHNGVVWTTAFSPDGNIVATGSADKTVILWNVETGKEKHRLVGHRADVYSVAFSPDGRYVVSGGRDSMAILWDVQSGRLITKLLCSDWVQACSFDNTETGDTSAQIRVVAAGAVLKAPDVYVLQVVSRLVL